MARDNRQLIDQIVTAYADDNIPPQVLDALMDEAEKVFTPADHEELQVRLTPLLACDMIAFLANQQPRPRGRYH